MAGGTDPAAQTGRGAACPAVCGHGKEPLQSRAVESRRRVERGAPGRARRCPRPGAPQVQRRERVPLRRPRAEVEARTAPDGRVEPPRAAAGRRVVRVVVSRVALAAGWQGGRCRWVRSSSRRRSACAACWGMTPLPSARSCAVRGRSRCSAVTQPGGRPMSHSTNGGASTGRPCRPGCVGYGAGRPVMSSQRCTAAAYSPQSTGPGSSRATRRARGPRAAATVTRLLPYAGLRLGRGDGDDDRGQHQIALRAALRGAAFRAVGRPRGRQES